MTALIIGGDYIGSLKQFLTNNGFEHIEHWSSRRGSDCHKMIPKGTRVVVMVTDYINHGIARKLKRVADDRNVPVLFTRNSATDLSQVFSRQFH